MLPATRPLALRAGSALGASAAASMDAVLLGPGRHFIRAYLGRTTLPVCPLPGTRVGLGLKGLLSSIPPLIQAVNELDLNAQLRST
jgi:hypothetical protein